MKPIYNPKKNEQKNHLMKVRVDYSGNNQWYMKPEFRKFGEPISRGHYIFRGDDESFRKHLIKWKVSDVDSDPPSYRSIRYGDIVQRMKEPKRTYVWMYSSKWDSMNKIGEKYEKN